MFNDHYVVMTSSFSGRHHTPESRRKIQLAILARKGVPQEALDKLAADVGLKWCSGCQEVLDIECFTTAPSKPDGRWQYCRDCDRAKKLEYSRTPAGRVGQRRRQVRHKYGLEPEDLDELLTEYPACAICRMPWDEEVRPRIDHCHVTKKNGGLLCDRCNLGLGSFRDDVVRLAAAIEYVKKHRGMVAHTRTPGAPGPERGSSGSLPSSG
jgi:hypothetical protein